MGKNLKGKEYGKDIYQRKNGLFSARYYDKSGKAFSQLQAIRQFERAMPAVYEKRA